MAPRFIGVLPHQHELMLALDEGHGYERRGVILLGGLGSGKTTAGAYMAVMHAIRNKAVHQLDGENPAVAVGVPSFTQAKGGSFAACIRVLRRMKIPYVKRTSGGTYDLRFDGTAIQWVSAEHPQAVEGWEPAGLWIDEPDSCRKWADPGHTTIGLWTERLRTDTARSLRYWFTGTPKGLLRIHEAINGDAATDTKALPDIVATIRASTESNPHNGPGYAERLRAQMSPKVARALMDGEIIDLTEGQAYEAFSTAAHVRPCAYTKDREVLVTFDFNRTPLNCQVIQRRSNDDYAGLDVLREFVIRETTTDEAARAVADYLRGLGHKAGVAIYGDPAGRSLSSKSARSDYDLIRGVLGTDFGPYEERYRRSATLQTDRVSAVNVALRDGLIAIDPSCKSLLRDLRQVTWKAGTQQIDKRDMSLTHASDALGYCVQQVYRSGGKLSSVFT